MIRTPERIFSTAALYLRIYLLGYPGLLLYDFGSALLRARGDSRYPFLALMISGAVNVGLNVFFVVVFRMGVAGVAIATDISTLLSAWLVLRRLAKDELFHPSLRGARLSLSAVWEVLKTGVPSAVQGAVFCLANIFVQASVNGFGETAIAGQHRRHDRYLRVPHRLDIHRVPGFPDPSHALSRVSALMGRDYPAGERMLHIYPPIE